MEKILNIVNNIGIFKKFYYSIMFKNKFIILIGIKMRELINVFKG